MLSMSVRPKCSVPLRVGPVVEITTFGVGNAAVRLGEGVVEAKMRFTAPLRVPKRCDVAYWGTQ